MEKLLIIFIGIGYLFPITVIWNCIDYWYLLFPDFNIEFVITFVYQLFLFLSVFIISFFTDFSFSFSIYSGFISQFIILFLISCLSFLNLSTCINYYIILFLISLLAISTSLLDCSLLSLISQYPNYLHKYLQIGIGISCFISISFRILTKFFISNLIILSTQLYFYLTLFTICICLFSFYILKNLPISYNVFNPNSFNDYYFLIDDNINLKKNIDDDSYNYLEQNLDHNSSTFYKIASKFALLTKIWKNCLSILFNFILTTSIYPSVITSINPISPYFSFNNNWYQILLLFIFAFSDTISRFFIKFRFGIKYYNVHYLILYRLGLVISLIFAVKFRFSDIFIFILIAMFGFSNGYMTSIVIICLNEIPGLANNEKKNIGKFTALLLNTGLCIGSFLSFFISLYLF
tara:strand:- start:64 stop:1281 length:1218 start_codon:yes stop_codon:yes gene_type:complete